MFSSLSLRSSERIERGSEAPVLHVLPHVLHVLLRPYNIPFIKIIIFPYFVSHNFFVITGDFQGHFHHDHCHSGKVLHEDVALRLHRFSHKGIPSPGYLHCYSWIYSPIGHTLCPQTCTYVDISHKYSRKCWYNYE